MSGRRQREAMGRRAETLACWWLRLTGWRVLARRLRTPRGEIDIVARRGRCVAFVEVKARADAGAWGDAVAPRRLERVAAAMRAVAHRYAGPEDTVRLDLLLLAPGRLPVHLANAWQGR